MSRLKDTNFFTLHGWMVNQLHLKGGELSAYALVHQFTQSEAGIYTGGVPYLAEWIGCGLTSARKYLHTLEGKGLIVHEDGFKNGVPFRYYKVVDSHIPQILEDTPQKVEGDTSNIGGSTPQKLEVEYNNKDKEKNNTPKGGSSKFVIPALEEVTDFIKEINALVDPEEFYNYYQSNGWKVGRNPMKDWRAAVRQWSAKRKKEQKATSKSKNYDYSSFDDIYKR